MSNYVCPNCGSDQTVKIIYGMVADEDLRERADRGEIHLAGCEMPIDNANRHCQACDCDFNSYRSK